MIANYYIPTKLTGQVDVIWEQRADHPMRWQILPSGAVELIFRLGPAVKDVRGKTINTQINPTKHFCFLSGLHTRPLYLGFPRFHFIGIQMSPIAVKALFGVPCAELKDWALDGSILFREINQIEDKLMSNIGFYQKAYWLEDFILNKINESADLNFAFKISKVVGEFALNQVTQDRTILDLTGYSRTHTHRLFLDWFGQAPTNHLRLIQFIRAIKTIHNSAKALTQIAHEFGYYDQAHFIRTFRQYANMTPKQYRKNKTAMIGQLDWL